MAHQFSTSYIKDSIGVFQYYKKLAERAIAQCPDAGLFTTPDAESNSIAVIVKHMAGNMRSRWTDFLTSDGEKPDRNRDSEFEAPPTTRAELMEMWERRWKLLFGACTEPHSVMQAINRQVAHYSYHVGQIVYLARQFAGDKWQTLTIPKKKSAEFNRQVAAGEKSQR